MTPSRVPNILPSPRVSNMRKNSTDQRGEAGIFTIASVKAMNVRPGPEADYKRKTVSQRETGRRRGEGALSIHHIIKIILSAQVFSDLNARSVYLNPDLKYPASCISAWH